MQAQISSCIPGSADLARIRFAQGEIEAGLVFAEGAIERLWTNPAMSQTLCANAQDCFVAALHLVRQSDVEGSWRLELELMLHELRQRLDSFKEAERLSVVAA